MRVHLWDRCFLLQQDSYRLGEALGQPAYQRLSATLLVANRKAFTLRVNGGPPQQYQAALIGPGVLRNSIDALDSDLNLLDAGITTPAYASLASQVARGKVRALEPEVCAGLQALLRPRFHQDLDCGEAQRLFADAIRLAVPQPPPAPVLDPRVEQVMRAVQASALDELSAQALARSVSLSEQRLRALFQKQLGCNLAQYMRWASAWKAIRLWREGRSFTDVAHEAGFHDLAHADRVLRELFGINPTMIVRTQEVRFQKCEW